MAAANLTAARLRELLHYDPSTDTWTRIKSHMRPDRVGKPITARDENGYLRAKVNGSTHRMHRLVWLWHTGQMPALFLDHRDGDVTNNRIGNLREATRSINAQNQRRPHSNNTTGFAGVSARGRKFIARLSLAGIPRMFLGYFDTAEAAYAAYLTAKRLHHPGNTL